MRNTNPFLLTDFYKTCHHNMYKPNMTKLVSYWCPRMSRIEGINEVVMFGLQGFIKKYLVDYFHYNFFNQHKDLLMFEYQSVISMTMGAEYADTTHLEALHDLGYLPIEISAVPEGTRVPIKVPMIQITNTHPDFAWLVNFLETFMSCHIWQPMTSASIAYRYREIMTEYYEKTVDDACQVINGAGDFSLRGMSCLESGEVSGAGHLLSFNKTANVPAIVYAEQYYDADMWFFSGTAGTEHSIMSSFSRDEVGCLDHLLNKYPSGTLSVVCDTYDYWNYLTNILLRCRDRIINRNGKLLVRGDSGDPIKIICGDPEADTNSPEYKGTVEVLWDIFGGYINAKGYKVLNPHVCAIYGDSITLERAEAIMKGLEAKGFAVSNVSLGIGSYTYQMNTRDTFGFALKATHAIIDGRETFIYKDPATDKDNFKKSQKGMCVVFEDDFGIGYEDEYNTESVKSVHGNLLEPVFRDGRLLVEQTFDEIRERLWKDERQILIPSKCN